MNAYSVIPALPTKFLTSPIFLGALTKYFNSGRVNGVN